MRGLSSSGKERIKDLIERLFDRVAVKLLGRIPSLRNNKNLFISAEPNMGLAHLFVQSLGNRPPNILEEDVLKGLLASSHGYLEALKHNTQSNVAEQVDGLIRQSIISGTPVDESRIQNILETEMDKAQNALKIVTEAESTKFRNVGSVMDITRVASERGIEDPNVFFIVVRDKATCEYCIKNHLHDNGTPKVFKLSEIKQSYLSTSEKKAGEVSVCGAHPMCRCTLSYLSPGYGFKRGKLEYITQGHDEYTFQKIS